MKEGQQKWQGPQKLLSLVDLSHQKVAVMRIIGVWPRGKRVLPPFPSNLAIGGHHGKVPPRVKFYAVERMDVAHKIKVLG